MIGSRLAFWLGKDGEATVVVFQPAAHCELTQVSLQALKKWMFLPQLGGDNPVEGPYPFPHSISLSLGNLLL